MTTTVPTALLGNTEAMRNKNGASIVSRDLEQAKAAHILRPATHACTDSSRAHPKHKFPNICRKLHDSTTEQFVTNERRVGYHQAPDGRCRTRAGLKLGMDFTPQ